MTTLLLQQIPRCSALHLRTPHHRGSPLRTHHLAGRLHPRKHCLGSLPYWPPCQIHHLLHRTHCHQPELLPQIPLPRKLRPRRPLSLQLLVVLQGQRSPLGAGHLPHTSSATSSIVSLPGLGILQGSHPPWPGRQDSSSGTVLRVPHGGLECRLHRVLRGTQSYQQHQSLSHWETQRQGTRRLRNPRRSLNCWWNW